jgi:hypothetical protein
MKTRYAKCPKCPAFHLLTEDRIQLIEKWEHKRQKQIDRIKKIRLILIGESMPNQRYFYDINTEYQNRGMRYNLKVEFDQEELSDSEFLESFRRKGIVLYDCGLCPIHKLDNNADMREAATYCFLTQNIKWIENNNSPIITIFPSNRGWKTTQIPDNIINRTRSKYSFNNIIGLKQDYELIKANNNDNT